MKFYLTGVRSAFLSSVFLVLVATVATVSAQDPSKQLTVENPADSSGFVVVKFKMNKGDDVVWNISPKPTRTLFYVDGEYSVVVLNGPGETKYTVEADWINWDAKKRGRPSVEFTIGKMPMPPPGPDPKPPGPDPTPTPNTGPLRVLMVLESGQTLTGNQQAVLYGEKVRTYLDSNAKGWNRFDKNVNGEKIPDETMRSVWLKNISRVTGTPCLIVASGDGATIKSDVVVLPNDQDAALELFKKWGGK